MADNPRHHPKKLERMKARKEHQTYRELAEEFGMSKSHAHRLVRKQDDDGEKDRED